MASSRSATGWYRETIAGNVVIRTKKRTAMPVLHFITHPEVLIDPSVPVPDWPLSPEGFRRMAVALEQPWMEGLSSVFSSAERKQPTPPCW